MGEWKMTIKMNRLTNIGFEAAGKWRLVSHGLELDLDKSLSGERDVLYAFAVNGSLTYIGKTALSLRERLQRYKTPAKTGEKGGSTNIKNNRNIIESLEAGQSVDIYIWRNQNKQRHGEFIISLAAGLETVLIEELTPPWNGRPLSDALRIVERSQLRPIVIKHAHKSRTEPRLSKDNFLIALRNILIDATRSGMAEIDVRSGPLHTKVGGYPGPSHSMPTCCNVMYAEMQPGDEVLEAPPKGRGASLLIRYRLPRD